MLRNVRPVLRMLGLTLLAACGGGDTPTGGSTPSQKTASLTVSVGNVPAGAAANVSVSGPNGFAHTVTATMTITGLTPGSYVISAGEITTAASIYAATPTSQNVELAAGSTRSVDVTYTLASGTLELAITGLPASSAAAVTVTGPNNYSRQVSATETLGKLAPGTYVIATAPVSVTGDGYAVAAASRTVDIAATAAPFVVGIAYAITTGRLQVTANGLPSGATPSFHVAGPNGFTHTATLGQVIMGLAPGTYTIGSPNVVAGGSMYVPGVPSVAITVAASAVPAQATVAYVIAGASLSISVVGLSQAALTVQGPNGYSASATATSTLSGLTTGTYTIVATPVAIGVHRYAATPATQSVNVPASGTVNASVTYAISTGLLSLSIAGVPGGAGAVTVSGPNGFSQVATSTQLLTTLTPGQYTLKGRAVLVAGSWWSPQPVKQTTVVPASVSAALAGVGYSNTLGIIAVSVSGLPTGVPAKVTIVGSLGVTDSLSASDTVPSLATGLYAVTAASVTANGITYTPALASQPVMLSAGALATVAVTYVAGGGGGGSGQLNLTIDNLYVTQAVQTYVGDVPLVAGRDGLVRVFVKASAANTAQPQVRVRLYSGTTLLTTLTLNAPAASVPTVVDDATLASAWYGVVSGSLIQPGLRILADVDPSNTVTEGAESDNTWPSSGAAATMFVKSVPTFSLRFVPIKQSNDLTGNVSAANTAAFLNDLRRMFPLGTINVDVRATYTTSAGVVQSSDQNGAWSTLLSEVNALRAVDASTRYYYGVVKTGYSSGVAGMGYLGAPAAIGWDYLPSGADVMAHELGHNWGRYHAPCGGAGSPDPAYPYAGGRIGVSGYDLTTSLFKPATTADVMGYCAPSWVSDFTYKGVMNYRDTHPMVASAQSARAPEPGLLVWGRVSGAQLVLEPAFEIVAPPKLPARNGPHRIEGLADDGTLLFSYGFDGDAIDHAQPQDRHFAFVVPFSVLRGQNLGTLRLRGHGRVAELRSSLLSRRALSDSSVARVRRVSGRGARVSWSDPNVRGVLVRDARTGEVLTFARGGAANLETATGDVEIVVSDGVRSRVRRVPVAMR